MIRVLIADDHDIVLCGLRMTINRESEMELVGEAVTGREAVELANSVQPDVILLDIQMPEMDGIEAATLIHKAHPEIAIIIFTNFASEAQLYAAIQAGVTGYLLKDTIGKDLVAAIHGAACHQPQLHPEIARRLMDQMPNPENPFVELTPREQDVLKLLARGFSNKEIANELFLSEVTVKGYVSAVLNKLDVSDRTKAALLAVRYYLVGTDELPDIRQ